MVDGCRVVYPLGVSMTKSDQPDKPVRNWVKAFRSASGPEPTTRHVLHALASYMFEGKPRCFPSMRTLSDDTGLTTRTICTHIEKAKEQGWLKVTQRKGKEKGWKLNHYEAAIPAHVRVEPDSTANADGVEPNADGVERGSTEAPKELSPKGEADKPPVSKWTECARLLAPFAGDEKKARKLIGGWCKDHKHDDKPKDETDGEVLEAVKAAVAADVAEPIAYVTRALQEKRKARGPQVKRLDPYAKRIEVRDAG